MSLIRLADHLSQVRRRKRELGIVDIPATIDAMRNKGGERTQEKRAMLSAASERSEAEGRRPVRAYF